MFTSNPEDVFMMYPLLLSLHRFSNVHFSPFRGGVTTSITIKHSLQTSWPVTLYCVLTV